MVKKNIKIFIKTILIGLLGGFIFNILLLPLPWMLGPAFSVAIFAFSGVNVDLSRNFRAPFVGLTGVWLGSYFQPSILNDIYIWMISLVFLVLYVPLAHLVSYYVLVKIRKRYWKNRCQKSQPYQTPWITQLLYGVFQKKQGRYLKTHWKTTNPQQFWYRIFLMHK